MLILCTDKQLAHVTKYLSAQLIERASSIDAVIRSACMHFIGHAAEVRETDDDDELASLSRAALIKRLSALLCSLCSRSEKSNWP
jgi:hypothetical protein